VTGWCEESLRGHLVDVFEPARANDFGYVVLYLHGVHLHRVKDDAVFTALFQQHGLKVVAPMTQQSWWTDRIYPKFDREITAEQHVLQHVLPFIESRWESKPPRIALLGTSMGGQGALRFAFKHPDTFPVAAAIAPAIDYHIKLREGDEVLEEMYRDVEQARQDTATLHVHPLYWPRNIWFSCDPADERWHESSDRLHMKLRSLGIPHECDLETSAGGHGTAYYNHMAPAAVAFIMRALERERMRIV
jgi:S-formylglutathione hydrolase FrmB